MVHVAYNQSNATKIQGFLKVCSVETTFVFILMDIEQDIEISLQRFFPVISATNNANVVNLKGKPLEDTTDVSCISSC